MATEIFPAGDSIHNTLGSLLLGDYVSYPSQRRGALIVLGITGNLAAGVFFGITIVQTHLFYARGQQDHLAIKVLMSPSRAIDAFHLIAISHSIYGFAVTNFGDPRPLLFPDWGILAMVATGVGSVSGSYSDSERSHKMLTQGISDAIVRGIYTFRIWRLGGNVWLVTLITMASFFVLGNVFAFIVEAKRLKDMISIARVSWILYLGFVAPAIADVFIALTLIVTLKHRRTGLEHTDSIIDALIYYSVQSGALTCILAVICLVTVPRFYPDHTHCLLNRFSQHILKPYTYMSFGVYFLMPKVYLNALLATLNARKGLRSSRGRSRGRELISMAFSKFQSRSARQNKRRRDEQDIRIQIETVTERVSDRPHPGDGEDESQPQVWEEKVGPFREMVVLGDTHQLPGKGPNDASLANGNHVEFK
ncbi:hypothetical protein NLI96_g5965 [Meripilus lineatus]|uniref:DUF6534 domain-containing protein n=1 Tax=Meripilus lineatus TaxID=2056292 RepID=A0AAD5V3T6_9APHY|nr:hypothetical protein NLI96_g5965 [Physisporinus lineatus]